MERSFDGQLLELVPLEFDKEEWIEDKRNILLAEGNDLVLFHYEKPGVYQGHYFFQSRGKEAVRLSKEALRIAFDVLQFKIIFGLVPEDNKGSYWISRHIGFKDTKKVETDHGQCTLFIMTKEEFNGRCS